MEIAAHEKVLIGKLYWLKNESTDLADQRKQFAVLQRERHTQRNSIPYHVESERAFQSQENQDRIQNCI